MSTSLSGLRRAAEYPRAPDLPLDLFLFATRRQLIPAADAAGIFSFIIDWENQGKHGRQDGHDTEVNLHTVEDLDRLAAIARRPITVRVNGGPAGLDEIEIALDHGAQILMQPMARSAADAERFLNRINGRAQSLVQIETQALVDDLDALRALPWDFAFIGLNDLMISRGRNWLWEPLLDGTVADICRRLHGRRIGFGGVTIVGGGSPISFIDLLREYARLDCSLSFLRRTFYRELGGRNLQLELDAVRAVWRAALARDARTVTSDAEEFQRRLQTIAPVACAPAFTRAI